MSEITHGDSGTGQLLNGMSIYIYQQVMKGRLFCYFYWNFAGRSIQPPPPGGDAIPSGPIPGDDAIMYTPNEKTVKRYGWIMKIPLTLIRCPLHTQLDCMHGNKDGFLFCFYCPSSRIPSLLSESSAGPFNVVNALHLFLLFTYMYTYPFYSYMVIRPCSHSPDGTICVCYWM